MNIEMVIQRLTDLEDKTQRQEAAIAEIKMELDFATKKMEENLLKLEKEGELTKEEALEARFKYRVGKDMSAEAEQKIEAEKINLQSLIQEQEQLKSEIEQTKEFQIIKNRELSKILQTEIEKNIAIKDEIVKAREEKNFEGENVKRIITSNSKVAEIEKEKKQLEAKVQMLVQMKKEQTRKDFQNVVEEQIKETQSKLDEVEKRYEEIVISVLENKLRYIDKIINVFEKERDEILFEIANVRIEKETPEVEELEKIEPVIDEPVVEELKKEEVASLEEKDDIDELKEEDKKEDLENTKGESPKSTPEIDLEELAKRAGIETEPIRPVEETKQEQTQEEKTEITQEDPVVTEPKKEEPVIGNVEPKTVRPIVERKSILEKIGLATFYREADVPVSEIKKEEQEIDETDEIEKEEETKALPVETKPKFRDRISSFFKKIKSRLFVVVEEQKQEEKEAVKEEVIEKYEKEPHVQDILEKKRQELQERMKTTKEIANREIQDREER